MSIIEHRTPEVVWYLEVDHLNTPIAARDPTGKIIWRWEADAFGSTQPDEDPDGDTQTTPINLRYPGQYYDKESGLHYNHRRYYDPKLGRYMSPDPIGLAGGINGYVYADNAPTMYIDSLGLNPATATGAGIGTAVGGPVGSVVGAVVGTVAGVIIANQINSAINSSSSSASSSSTSPPQQCKNDDECEKKLQQDEALCVAIAGSRYGPAGVASCKRSTMQRYAECLRFGVGGIRTPLHGVDTPL